MSFTNLSLGHNWEADEWPEHVEVDHDDGRGDGPRRYVPERTCHVERVSTPYHAGPPRCSACMMPLEPLVNYCPYCGARLGEVDS